MNQQMGDVSCHLAFQASNKEIKFGKKIKTIKGIEQTQASGSRGQEEVTGWALAFTECWHCTSTLNRVTTAHGHSPHLHLQALPPMYHPIPHLSQPLAVWTRPTTNNQKLQALVTLNKEQDPGLESQLHTLEPPHTHLYKGGFLGPSELTLRLAALPTLTSGTSGNRSLSCLTNSSWIHPPALFPFPSPPEFL